MGVEPKDCRIVARMVGIKTFINEFIAYEDLGKVKANRKTYYSLMGTSSLLSGDWMVDGSSNWIHKGANVTLTGGMITVSKTVWSLGLCYGTVELQWLNTFGTIKICLPQLG